MDVTGSRVWSDEDFETKARIVKNQTKVVQLEKELLDLHAEDYRSMFEMNITNLRSQIKKDEELLKGMNDE